MSDADEIAAALAAAGTDVCFGVPGGGVNLDLVGACGRHGIRFVLTHTETAAVIAAGVWGELTGRPGLALCTRGPGLAAALNGIAQAHLDRQPVVVVADGAGFAHPHQRIDHAAMVAPLSKGTVSDPGGGGRARAGAAVGPGADRRRRARARGSGRLRDRAGARRRAAAGDAAGGARRRRRPRQRGRDPRPRP